VGKDGSCAAITTVKRPVAFAHPTRDRSGGHLGIKFKQFFKSLRVVSEVAANIDVLKHFFIMLVRFRRERACAYDN
jgi:hypothetical protein